MTRFYPLAISDIRKETADCVSIAFDIPPHLKELFTYHAGQNITVRKNINGEEIRRSYSICSSPHDNELRIAVKHLDEGKFSGHANRELKPGEILEVMPPTGRFSSQHTQQRGGKYLAFAAGSGITPVISIIRTVLTRDPESRFTLVYGNRSRSSIIFGEQLEALKNRYINRFVIHHILSREKTDALVNSGRIDAAKCEELSKQLIDVSRMDHIFICGPEQMIFAVRNWLLTKGVSKEKIHFELFTTPGQELLKTEKTSSLSGNSSVVRLKLDGVVITFDVPFDSVSILDAALKHGADLPYACKGGVCATCRAKLLSGQVEMDTNYALEQDELDAGFILTCQSHPRSAEIDIDFDAR